MQSDKVLKRWYRAINKRFFAGELPNNVCVRWARDTEEKEIKWEEQYFGWTTERESEGHDPKHFVFTIILSRAKLRPLTHRKFSHSAILSTLAHEMIHVATALRDNHGPAFESWRKLIGDRGIFKKHALVKDLTIF